MLKDMILKSCLGIFFTCTIKPMEITDCQILPDLTDTRPIPPTVSADGFKFKIQPKIKRKSARFRTS